MAARPQTPTARDRDVFAELHRLVKSVHAVVAAADAVALWLVRGDELVYACGAGDAPAEVGASLPVHRGLPGMAVRRGVTVCSDRGCDRDQSDQPGYGEDRPSLAASPLRDSGEVFGALEISAERPGAFSTETVAQLDALSDVAAQAAGRALQAAGTGSDRVHPDRPEQVAGSARASEVAAGMSSAHRIRRAIEGWGITICGQPIARLADGGVAAVEALARFAGAASLDPAAWFTRAHELGLGLELERATTRRALSHAASLPDGVRLSINLSPAALLDPEMVRMLSGSCPGRLIVELTEHAEVSDYEQVRRMASAMRAAGALLAVDDAGAGYSSLLHVVKLVPDLIKLDRCLIQGLDRDPVRRHLCGSLAAFSRRIDAEVVAEGIETAGELEVVQELGISLGQGYLLERPQPFERLSFVLDHLTPVTLAGGSGR